MNIDEFKNMVKTKRKEITKPYDLVFQEFEKLKINNLSESYIQNNASNLIEELRNATWQAFKPIEHTFTINVLKELIVKDGANNIINAKNGTNAAIAFAKNYSDHIYQLNLSNTNSRRSRAGKEFEAILELLLMACGLAMDSQGNIGKKEFVKKGLGKMVDIVTPSATHFTINKYNTVLISAKTTLRERWQEVSEETNRTSATSMYLATLEDNITGEVISSLNEVGVRLAVPKKLKDTTYASYESVVSYEDLFRTIIDTEDKWDKHSFSDTELNEISNRFDMQEKKHGDHKFVKNYYENKIADYKKMKNN